MFCAAHQDQSTSSERCYALNVAVNQTQAKTRPVRDGWIFRPPRPAPTPLLLTRAADSSMV